MSQRLQNFLGSIRIRMGLQWGKRFPVQLVAIALVMSALILPNRSYGPPIPVCPDCAIPRQPSTTNVYVKSPVTVNQGTVIQKLVFPGMEVRQDFPVRAGRKYYFYLLPHSGNPDLGISHTLIHPWLMPDWQWMPNPGSAFEGNVVSPAVNGFVSVKVRGAGSRFSSYSLVVFER